MESTPAPADDDDSVSSKPRCSSFTEPPEVVDTTAGDGEQGSPTVALPLKRPPIERVSMKKTCWAWEYIFKFSDGIVVNSRPSRMQRVGIPCEFVCRLCYEDKANIPVMDCVVALHNNGISNGISHLQCKHRLSDPAAELKNKAATPMKLNYSIAAASATIILAKLR